jgi:tetratricopeptide (TPR) repeat protein
MRSLLIASLVLALTAPAFASTLVLKDGTTLSGHAVRYDSPSKTLYFHTDDGRDVQYTLDQFDARSLYVLNASMVPKDDAPKQLMVANYARDIGLYAHAVRRYGETLKTDPSLKDTVDREMAKLRKMAAADCWKNAEAAKSKGDAREAEKWLTTLIDKLPDEPEAAKAKTLLDEYYAKNRAEKMAQADAKASANLQKDVEKGKKLYQQMVDKCTKGLQAQTPSQAQSLFRSAIADGQSVLDEIDRVEKTSDLTGAQREAADGYRKVVIEQMVETNLHIASQQTVQTDYNGALKTVNAALALDPQNQSALAARARIETSVNSGWGWGGRRGL